MRITLNSVTQTSKVFRLLEMKTVIILLNWVTTWNILCGFRPQIKQNYYNFGTYLLFSFYFMEVIWNGNYNWNIKFKVNVSFLKIVLNSNTDKKYFNCLKNLTSTELLITREIIFLQFKLKKITAFFRKLNISNIINL